MLTGIQIGPRQFELPPNMPLSESPGRYDTRYSWSPDPVDVGVLLVNAGDGSNAEGAQEFLLIEHDLQHPAEIGFVQDRRQQAILVAGLERVMNERHQFRTPVEILAHLRADLRVFASTAFLRKR